MGLARRLVFREPDGRRKGVGFLLLSIVCLLLWVYTGLVLHGPSLFFLFTGVAFACSGTAESLPQDQRRPAGTLRLLGIGVISSYLVFLVSPLNIFG
jgi:hypothetical protein